jgi:hypothetical protein
MDSVGISTLRAFFGFDIPFFVLVFLEPCGDLEITTLETPFRCFIVSEMMVVRAMSGFQC